MKKDIHKTEIDEAKHFQQVLEKTGDTYWGNRTIIGQHRQDMRADIAITYFEPAEDEIILDIGCGVGCFSVKLADRCESKITGIDITEASINQAIKINKRDTIEYLVGSVYDLPYRDNSINNVCGNAVLHHFDLEKALPEIKRVLKPGGKLIFFEPNMLNPHIYLEKNVRFIGKLLQNSEDETAFFKKEIYTEFVSFGFQNVEVIPFDFMHPMLPGVFLNPLKVMNSLLEKIPVIKEVSGSLIIKASKN